MSKKTKNIERSKEFIFQKGLSQLEELAWYDYESRDTETDLGNAYMETKQYEAAAQHYLEALRFDPNNITARYALAITYIKTGDFDDSIECFGDIIEYIESADDDDLLDQYKGVYYAVGLACYKTGRYGGAVEYLGRYNEFDVESKNSYYLIATICFEWGKIDGVLYNIQLFNKFDKAYDATSVIKGIQHYLGGEYEAALHEFDKSDDYPYFKSFTCCLQARCYGELGNPRQGMTIIDQIISIDTDTPFVLMTRGDLYYALGLEHEAISDYQAVVTHYERSVSISGDIYGKTCARLGMIHFKLGNYEKAFSSFNKTSEEHLAFLIGLARQKNSLVQDYLSARDVDY